MPTAAMVAHDLKTLSRSWLIRLWVIAAVAMTVLIVLTNWQRLPDSVLISAVLFPFLVFPWYFVVIALGIYPVAGGRIEQVADGILCRPVTRHEFLLAAWLARVILVVGVVLTITTVTSAVVILADRPPAPDGVTMYGLVTGAAVVSVVLVALVSLGFFFGTLLKNTLLALLVMLFVWYPINLVLNTFHLEEISPISLNQALPTMLRATWSTENDDAIDPSELAELQQQAQAFLQALSGQQPPPRRRDFFGHEDLYRDTVLWRVFLGYGLPIVVTMTLAVWKFRREDL